MGYVLGFSSGAFGVAGAEEKQQLVGLSEKAESTITKGVNFVQLDLESLSEFEEPELEKKMKEDIMEKLGIKFGIHSETRAFGVEAAELDSAEKMEYERGHERICRILENSKKIGAKYVLIHSSESEPFRLLERTLQSSDLVDPFGRPLRDFLKENEWLLNWLLYGTKDDRKNEMVEALMEIWRKKRTEITSEDVEKALEEKGIRSQKFFWLELLRGRTLEEFFVDIMVGRAQEIEIREEWVSEERKNAQIDFHLQKMLPIRIQDLKDHVISMVQSRDLHYGPEKWAYYFVARWMEENKDPLWEKIVNASIKFFAVREGKSVEEWMNSKNINPLKLSIEDDNFREKYEIWVPAVSAKYIYGHLFPLGKYEDPKKYLDGMFLAFESPMGGRGIEEWLRLPNPYQYYFLVEEANKRAGRDIFAVSLDFEHMLSLRIDPEKVIDLLPENGGKYVRVIHAGSPSTLAPAHMPIEVGSEEQIYLYKMYYKLRQKGFGKDDRDYYIIFERGGPETFHQSIIALRLIIENLEKDVPPDKLIEHPEFFGLNISQILSPERQRVVIKEHAFDPLKGLMMVPEEEHGFLGRAAVERGKAEEWRKGRYR